MKSMIERAVFLDNSILDRMLNAIGIALRRTRSGRCFLRFADDNAAFVIAFDGKMFFKKFLGSKQAVLHKVLMHVKKFYVHRWTPDEKVLVIDNPFLGCTCLEEIEMEIDLANGESARRKLI